MADTEAEEKRLLDSFRLHELEVGHVESERRELVESQAIESLPEPNDKEEHKSGSGKKHKKPSRILDKEEEVLGGTFGNPDKLKEMRKHKNNEAKTEDDINNEDAEFMTPQLKTEPGPAFMNSSMQEQTPKEKGKNNPFHWDDSSNSNLDKLVGMGQQESNQRAAKGQETRVEHSIRTENT